MWGHRRTDVLVIGAGPVGLLAGLVLARRGVAVRIVDRDWRTGAHSYALLLHGRSVQLLEELGLREAVLAGAVPLRRIRFCDRSGCRAVLEWEGLPTGVPLPVVLRQDALEAGLEKALSAAEVSVHWNHEVSSLVPEADGVRVILHRLEKETVGYAALHTEWVVAGTQELKIPWVVAADGHRSRSRRALGIEFIETGPPQHFGVFEFRTSGCREPEMCVVLEGEGMAAAWPLPQSFCRWSFELPHLEPPESTRDKQRLAVQIGTAVFPALGEEELRTLLGRRVPWFTGNIEEVRWRIVVRFERRLASLFGRDRVWLAGDAAHTAGPIGAHSMNVGLLEARELADTLADIVAGRDSPAHLDAYNQRRLAQWRFLLGLENGLRPSATCDPWVAGQAARILGCLPASGPELRAMAQGLGLEMGD